MRMIFKKFRKMNDLSKKRFYVMSSMKKLDSKVFSPTKIFKMFEEIKLIFLEIPLLKYVKNPNNSVLVIDLPILLSVHVFFCIFHDTLLFCLLSLRL